MFVWGRDAKVKKDGAGLSSLGTSTMLQTATCSGFIRTVIFGKMQSSHSNGVDTGTTFVDKGTVVRAMTLDRTNWVGDAAT